MIPEGYVEVITQKNLKKYCNLKEKPKNLRYTDFVLLPFDPILDPNLNLGTETKTFIKMGVNTIKMLKNNKKKMVFPFPLIPSVKESLINEKIPQFYITEELREKILKEKQFSHCFNIVAHGDEDSIGNLEGDRQFEGKEYAVFFDKFLQNNQLELKNKDFKVHFHTCNTAYAEVDKEMSREEILEKVYEESFVGLFYKKLKKLGYNKITVIGYRGYYCTIKTNSSSSAIVQSEFYNDRSYQLDAKKAEYTIENDACTCNTDNISELTFYVLL